MFNNLKTEGIEAARDSLGGPSILNTDVYPGKVKVAYAGHSSTGAMFVSLELLLEGGKEYKERIFVTSGRDKGQKNYYERDGKKYPMPGFTAIDDLVLISTGAPLAEAETEDKVLKVYDPDEKKEVNKSVPVITGLTGVDVLVAIQHSKEDEQKKNDSTGEYEATGKTVDRNNIEKFFHPEYKLTVSEAKAGAETAAFLPAWVEKNKDKVRDKTKAGKSGQNGQSGAPGSGNKAPQAGQASAAPRKSLFGNKG